MVLNAAVHMLREADELKQKILKFKSGTSMLQERSLWVTQQQLQKIYQKVLVLDLDYALEKKVEQDLWNVGFKQQIEALQAISKDRKNPLRSEGQAMLSWVLQAAAGFYLCLLHQICTTFKLDLPFRRRASLLGWVEGWGAGEAGGEARLPAPAAARYICQHCLVHLGDLARYRQQLRVAHSFYRQALVVSAHSGQPYNQLALVAWRRGRRLAALYWHVRSLLVRAPFPPAPANLARTLHAAAAAATQASGAAGRDSSLPVLPGVEASVPAPGAEAPRGRLDAHAYVSELIRAVHLIHTVDQLDTAEKIVNSLNSSLTALIATDSFESMTLIKMSCVLIWLVVSCTEELKVDSSALSEGEAAAAALAESLAASAMLALLLPAYTLPEPPQRALPALKVWLGWATCAPTLLRRPAWSSRAALLPALAHALNKLAPTVPAPLPDHHLLKVWLGWATCAPTLLRRPAWSSRAALLPALAHALNKLAPAVPAPLPDHHLYESVPLPEDEELQGFLPLEEALRGLRFDTEAWDTYAGRVPDLPHLARPAPADTTATAGDAPTTDERDPQDAPEPVVDEQITCIMALRFDTEAWDTYAGRVPDLPHLPRPAPVATETTATAGDAPAIEERDAQDAPEAAVDEQARVMSSACLSGSPALERRVRAHRLLRLARRLAQLLPDLLEYTDGAETPLRVVCAAGAQEGGAQLAEALAGLASLPQGVPGADDDGDSDDEPAMPPLPVVISEADFREKVIEKRVGILKPQGSLERAREERALASTQDDPDTDGGEDLSKSDREDKKETRKQRVNIAMAAIMRKQEETNKQVKFVTPPPTPESATDSVETKDADKPKVIQPKAIKTLTNLPLGRKTGGILALKDKSGYPHLVNTDPDPPKKTEKEDKKEQKPQNSSQNSQSYQPTSQSYQPKRQDVPQSPKWGQYNDGPRMNFQKNFGVPGTGAYNPGNPSYPSPPTVGGAGHAPGIRLPVVNPKEIDVRTAALQKQNSRQDLFQDGHKFGTYNYQMSGDKKNFLNDLPPRFANQYRYWQGAQDGPDNKFRDDKPAFPPAAAAAAAAAWPAREPYAQPPPWWKPDAPQEYAAYSQAAGPASQSFYSAPGYPGAYRAAAPAKPDLPAPYMQPMGQPQHQTLQGMVNSPNFNSAMNSFGTYAPSVGYDAGMYPQFAKLGFPDQQQQMYRKDLMDGGLGFGQNAMDAQRNMAMKFTDLNLNSETARSSMDQPGVPGGSGSGAGAGSTYSLFSGADAPAWTPAAHHQPQQSLWSGPGPSPLERLLEQQKQMKPQ